MNQVAMITLLNTLSISSFYDHAPVGTALPFGVIHTEQPDNFVADNLVYCEKWNFRFDLYTVEKDLTLEAGIKKLLNDNGIAWTKTPPSKSKSCSKAALKAVLLCRPVPPPAKTKLLNCVTAIRPVTWAKAS